MDYPKKRRSLPNESAELDDPIDRPGFLQKPPKPGANLLFLRQNEGFRSSMQRLERGLQSLPILKDVFLMIRPAQTWDRVVVQKRGAWFVFAVYLLPMLLLLGFVEGHGLMLLGRQQVARGGFNRFTLSKVFVYETANLLLALVLMVVAAIFIKFLANTCFKRNHLAQSLTVLFFAMGPMYLVELFNGFLNMYVWLTWLAGIYLVVGTLYHGLPRIMQPDPPAAMGLYFGSASLVFLLMFIGRLVTYYYLEGRFKVLERHLSDIAARLPF
jgi:hypothetical protein